MHRIRFSGKYVAALLILVILTAGSRAGQAQSAPTDVRYLLTDKEAVLLLPPELVTTHVLDMDWAPDSKHVVAVRYHQPLVNPTLPPPPAEIGIAVWNGLALHTTEAWKKTLPNGGNPRGGLQWLPTTSTAIQEIDWVEKETQPGPDNKPVESYEMKHLLLWIDSQRGFVKEIPERDGDQIFVSPARSLSVIIHGWPNFAPDRTYTLTSVRSDGVLSQPTPLPEKMDIIVAFWSEDGSMLNLMLQEKLPDNKGVLPHWVQFSPLTGHLTPLMKKPANYKPLPKSAPGPFTIKPAALKAQQADTTLNVPALWLESTTKSELPRTLISADAKNGKVAPDGNAVLYSSQGAAWVTPLFRVSKEEYKAAQIKAQRAVAMNNAKQLGLGILMWAEDHDEAYPSPDNINAEITPYLLNDSLFEGFTYTYKGGPIADVAEPANTELGTVEGPGGVAIIYADGHAKWKNR